MIRRSEWALLCAGMALFCAGCSVALNFYECRVDQDCAGRAVAGVPGKMACTADHLCVNRLCEEEPVGVNGTEPYATVAGLFRLSGASSEKDSARANAMLLGASEVNSTLAGAQIRVFLCDTAGDPKLAEQALSEAVVDHGAVAVVGPSSSSEMQALVSTILPENVLVVSPSATSREITGLADSNLIWRTAVSDSLQSEVLAQQAMSYASATAPVVDVLYVDDVYGRDLKSDFVEAYCAPSRKELAFPVGDFSSELDQLASLQDPSTLNIELLVADADAPALIQSVAGNAAFARTQFLMTDAAKVPEIFSWADPTNADQVAVFERLLGTGPTVSMLPVYNAFQSTYQSRFGIVPTDVAYVANTYDAFYAVAIAVGAVLTCSDCNTQPNGTNLSQMMARMAVPGGTLIDVGPVSYGSAVGILADPTTAGIDLSGVSGPIDFDAHGDVLAPFEVWSVTADDPGAPLHFVTLDQVNPLAAGQPCSGSSL